jgi:hypothetical protein
LLKRGDPVMTRTRKQINAEKKRKLACAKP